MSRPVEIVRKCCPKARSTYLSAFENGDALFKQHGITTPLRLAHFLAQVCHESGGLAIEWESGAYSSHRLLEIFGEGNHSAAITPAEAERLAYNGPAIFERVYGLGNPNKAKTLGNLRPGDGWRFRGGGLMQTTGGFNYRSMGLKCGVDFYTHPHLVLSAEHALKPALAEWTQQKCNVFADNDDILSISRAINIGNPYSSKQPNGMADRRYWLNRFKLAIDRVDLKAAPAVVPPVKPPVISAKTGTAGAIVAAGAGATAAVAAKGYDVITIVTLAAAFAIAAAVAWVILHNRRAPNP